MFFSATVMRRHLAAVTFAFSLGEIVDRKLPRADAATEHERTIAIVGDNVIVLLHLNRDGRECFVPHAGDMEVTLALTIQILLAQIPVPALEQDRQKPQFVLPGQFRHRANLNEKTSTCFLQRISPSYAVNRCKTNRKNHALSRARWV